MWNMDSIDRINNANQTYEVLVKIKRQIDINRKFYFKRFVAKGYVCPAGLLDNIVEGK